MRPKDEAQRREAEAERHFIGLVREAQMSTVLPYARQLGRDELSLLFTLAVSASRRHGVHLVEELTTQSATQPAPAPTGRKSRSTRSGKFNSGLGPS